MYNNFATGLRYKKLAFNIIEKTKLKWVHILKIHIQPAVTILRRQEMEKMSTFDDTTKGALPIKVFWEPDEK